MQENKRALVLLNMGGARNKEELKMFLSNMFNDRNILTTKNELVRKIMAYFIVKSRLNEAWENYEEIGGESPINPITESLVNKCNEKLEGFKVYQAMAYTPPFTQEVLAQIEKDGIKDILLLPLYPQFSTTTTKSSVQEFIEWTPYDYKLKYLEEFYTNNMYNDCIVNEIASKTDDASEYNLVFSAHGLPQKIVDKGDPYQEQMEEHVEILTEKIKAKNMYFKSITLAYQSKVGPMKWLEPSLDEILKNFKGQKVIVYPIAFIIDNSETDFELEIEYREIAENIGVEEFKVCKCLNDSDEFVEAIADIIKQA